MSIAGIPGVCGFLNGVHQMLDGFIRNDDFQLGFGHLVKSPPLHGQPVCGRNRDGWQIADLVQSVDDMLQHERLNDGFDFFHMVCDFGLEFGLSLPLPSRFLRRNVV